MAKLSQLWIGTLTSSSSGSGTDADVSLSIDGNSSLSHVFPDTEQDDFERGKSNLYGIDVTGSDVDSENMGAIRFDISPGDIWRPDTIVVWGEALPIAVTEPIVPLAMSVDINQTIPPSFTVEPVRLGNTTMDIARLLLIVKTGSIVTHNASIRIARQDAADDLIIDDLEENKANLFVFGPFRESEAFTKNDLTNTSITLHTNIGHSIGRWKPDAVFLFGLDTRSGPPQHLLPLVHIPEWPFGDLAFDTRKTVTLPIVADPLDVGGGPLSTSLSA